MTLKALSAMVVTVAMLVIVPSLIGAVAAAQAPPGVNNGQGGAPVVDVVVTGVGFSDDEPLEDDEITIYATVLNNGPMPVKNLTVTFLLDGQELFNITNVSIGGNQSEVVETVWKSEKWNHEISAMVAINGTPLKDSVASTSISVEAKPIGDFQTVGASLLGIFAVVLGTALVPGLRNGRMSTRK